MYRTIAIAGTFDRLHKGHRFFISQAFKSGEKVIIGLTSDIYVKRKLQIIPPQRDPASGGTNYKLQINTKLQIQNYQERKDELENFLKQKGLLDRAEIIKIDDVYGPAADESEIEALVVTSETLDGGRLVNKRRKDKGLKLLKILKVPLIPAQDRKRIASTRIRLGEIDRWGRIYAKFKVQSSKFKVNEKDKYKISEELRQELKKPLDRLIAGDPDNHRQLASKLKNTINNLKPVMMITVGDEVTKLCNEFGETAGLSIIDFKVKRKKKYRSLKELGFTSSFARGPLAKDVRRVRNPAGNITRTLVAAVHYAVKSYLKDGRNRIIEVIGEEDLAGVPAILLSPLGGLVIYGQPDEGLVVAEITEEKKQQLFVLMQRHRQ